MCKNKNRCKKCSTETVITWEQVGRATFIGGKVILSLAIALVAIGGQYWITAQNEGPSWAQVAFFNFLIVAATTFIWAIWDGKDE